MCVMERVLSCSLTKKKYEKGRQNTKNTGVVFHTNREKMNGLIMLHYKGRSNNSGLERKLMSGPNFSRWRPRAPVRNERQRKREGERGGAGLLSAADTITITL
jgi:hypothetical protein